VQELAVTVTDAALTAVHTRTKIFSFFVKSAWYRQAKDREPFDHHQHDSTLIGAISAGYGVAFSHFFDGAATSLPRLRLGIVGVVSSQR
jgi:hypothetical protein